MKQWLMPLTILMTSWLPDVWGGPVTTCSQQSKCFSLNYTQTSGAPCVGTGSCAYQVCITVNSAKPGCDKAGDTISHGCFSPNPLCDSVSSGSYDFSAAKNETYYPTDFKDYSRCFDVKPGDALYFILKDGAGGGQDAGCSADLSNYASVLAPLPADSTATCAPTISSTGKSCSGNGNVGKECVWKLVLPSCTNFNTQSDSCTCNDRYRTSECLREENNHAGWEAANVPNCNFNTLFNMLKDEYDCEEADCGGDSMYCNKNIPPEVQAKFTNCQEYIKEYTPVTRNFDDVLAPN